jgi:hypothetical protein
MCLRCGSGVNGKPAKEFPVLVDLIGLVISTPSGRSLAAYPGRHKPFCTHAISLTAQPVSLVSAPRPSLVQAGAGHSPRLGSSGFRRKPTRIRLPQCGRVLDRTSRHAIVASVAFSGAGTTVSSQNRLDLARDLLRLEIGAPERGGKFTCCKPATCPWASTRSSFFRFGLRSSGQKWLEACPKVELTSSNRHDKSSPAAKHRRGDQWILRSSAGSLYVEMAGGTSRPSTRTYDKPISPWATRRPCGYE